MKTSVYILWDMLNIMNEKMSKREKLKRRKVSLAIAAIVSAVVLTGCGGTGNLVQRYSDSGRMEFPWEAEHSVSHDIETESAFSITQDSEEEISAGDSQQPDAVLPSESDADDEPESVIIPRLPLTGSQLTDFVPEDWWLLDSVELDFNEDGIFDYVAVLQVEWKENRRTSEYPRILFAVASEGAGQYRLDFQNENLIRNSEEGGVDGDPYLPLTAEGKAFTTHSYGGSEWRWSEDYTYEYMEGTWYLTLAEEIDGYQDYITEYSRDDWKSGVGIRKERNAKFSDMEEHWDEEVEPVYDLAYEMTLDEMPTLYQAGMRRTDALDYVTDWEVQSIEFGEGVEPAEDLVRYPGTDIWFSYSDENCALYIYINEESLKKYLVMYRWLDKKLIVLAELDPKSIYGYKTQLKLYKDYIYYVSDIVEDIKYRTLRDGKESIKEGEETVGLRLNRVNLDGTGQMTILEYRYPGTEQEIIDSRLPYMAFNYEISGDEIVAELWIGDRPHPYYRMNLDGTGQQIIGYVSK